MHRCHRSKYRLNELIRYVKKNSEENSKNKNEMDIANRFLHNIYMIIAKN